MRSQTLHSWRQYTWIVTGVVLLFLALACGPGAEPTPTATAVPTVAPVATPTTAPAGPAATPTPTTVAAPTPTPGEQPIRGGSFFMAVGYFPESYDAHIAGSNTVDAGRYFGKVYSNVFINAGPSPLESKASCEICVPNGWKQEDGGKTWVIDMIQGIKFSNGQEMTSADVKYSLNKIMGHVDGVQAPRVGVIKEYIESIETPSRYQVKIHLLRPSAYVPTVLGMSHGGNIYPEGTTREDLKTKLVGSGPFLLKNEVKGVSWLLERNPNYFKPGLPYLDKFEFVVVPDAASRHAAFVTGKMLKTYETGLQYLPQLYQMEKDGKVNLVLQYGYCGPFGEYMNNTKPPFNELKMRQAMNLAIDRKELGKVMWPGLEALPQLLYYTRDYEYGLPDEKIWNVVPGWGTGAKKNQEIEQARQLVKDAGYANGIDIKMMVRTAGTVSASHELVQQMVGQVGIRAAFDIVDGPTQIARMQKLEYAFQHYVLCVPTRDPDEVIGVYWVTGGSRNTTGYTNPQMDKLFVQMSSELDPVKRLDLFRQIQDIIIVKDVGYAPAPLTNGLHWYRKELRGLVFGPDVDWHASSGHNRGETLWIKR